MLKTNPYNWTIDLLQTLLRFVASYKHQLPQSYLKGKTPVEMLNDALYFVPNLFHKLPYDRPTDQK